MRQRTKVAIGLAAAGALAGVALIGTSGPRDAATIAGEETRITATDAAVALQRQPWMGHDAARKPVASRYRLDYGATLRFTAGHEALGIPAESRMAVVAQLELAPVSPPSGEAGWVAGRLLDVQMSGDASLFGRAALPLDTPAAALEAPFMVRFDETGAAVERRFSDAMPEGARNIVGSILTGLQVVRPTDVRVVDGAWQADEEGLDGPFHATYAERHDGITKGWQRVVALDGSPLEGAGGLTTRGEASWAWGAGADAAARGTLKVTLSGDASLDEQMPLALTSETTATLVRQRATPGAWASALKPEAFGARDGVAEVEHAASVTADPLPAASGRTPDAIMAASTAAHLAGNSMARREAMRDLAATIRQDPKALGFVEAQLRTNIEGDPLRTLVEALTHAETPESLALMNDVLSDPGAPAITRHALAVGAGMMENPTAAIIETLLTLSSGTLDPVGTAALMGLGVQGNEKHAGPHTAAIRENVLARAEGVLGGASTPTQQDKPGLPPAWDLEPGIIEAWLGAVGNLGGAEAWPLMAPYLKHPNEWVRLAAVGGLTYVPGRPVQVAVAEMIEIDPSHWVRRRAVQTAGNLPQSSFEAIIIRTMREDDAPDVRLECARVLAVWGLESPGLYALIAEAERREPDRTTKKIMAQLQPELIGKPGVDDTEAARTQTAPVPTGGNP